MVEIDAALVKNLIAAQFPDWADLSVRPVANGGWDNRTFHLGETMLVRLPSAERYVAQVEKEHRFLPAFGPQLPLPIPVPLGLGKPGEGYPWPWSVYAWIAGDRSSLQAIANLTVFAEDLADFLLALRKIDPSDGPPPGPHNFFRGGALEVYDNETRRSIRVLADQIDVPLITEIWERALASTWKNRPVWVHGDVAEGNLLVRDGRLAAVIDFGSSGTGDPACDLVIAWTLFDEPAAHAFRNRVKLDTETWERARGWCLWKALITAAGEPGTNPLVKDEHRRWIDRIVADHLGQA
ncbi:aminoglycoside phosphotransferase family protein [Neorhizobium galegae]|uniref:Aminoglycoside phosphotransferase n=1 Tax=Neorhizobium galegae bv. orientalis str. HAMBI 540 TaxID=1028800 RepID=A0A068SL60_NEOGA|nr:aminoglycoside phosphotransferase family protein [Neorhizobium galegae]CDN46918.1 Aminoglycoside phosphotransferase [Neorhizobium galegae bv. orientalis str. HAMBI 540]CDZ53582.1 Aminoglycoside phosphotransferase [Neorhizobium galegae bv. orientalis]